MKRIYVSQFNIKTNKETGSRLPTIMVEEDGVARVYEEVEILGPSKVVYRPDEPSFSSATAWIETEAELVVK